jgi:hypothetical protein
MATSVKDASIHTAIIHPIVLLSVVDHHYRVAEGWSFFFRLFFFFFFKKARLVQTCPFCLSVLPKHGGRTVGGFQSEIPICCRRCGFFSFFLLFLFFFLLWAVAVLLSCVCSVGTQRRVVGVLLGTVKDGGT